jgi:serine/threonine protein kinase/tetratricopeptide (TPR) repeat protein
MPLASGTRLGPYEIIAALGAGGMGEVYRARDTRLNRTIAIKILPRDVANDPDRLRRFEQEAQAASALNHPNILTIYDIGQENGVSFIAMEWVQGGTLRDLLAAGRLPARHLADIAHQTAEGLAKAHAAGIVHRDLKPENIMISDDGLVKIVDFGLAKLNAPASPEFSQAVTASAGTAAGIVMGTVGYMSPEQASGRAADHRSDQFSLGLIAYEAVTSKRPFARPTAAQTMAATIDVEPEPVSTLNRDVPPHLALVIHRCLEKNPANRYESTRDLAHDLKHAATGAVSVGDPPVRVRRPLPIAIAAAILFMAVAGAVWIWQHREPPAREPSSPLVAVRPFRNLSADPSQSYFTEGVTDEIRGQLSKIAALRVLSRLAVERFGNADGPAIARDFGVQSLVEGSVRVEGGRVRVAVELVDAATQQTRWSEQYDRDLADVLSVQRDVALQIAQNLAATLSPAERERVEKLPTKNTDAYELYLRSQALSGLADLKRNQQGIALLEQALALDPQFALAKAKLSYRVFFRAYTEDRKYADEAIALALAAAAADPTLADPHATLGSAYGLMGRLEPSRLSFLRALELDPNHGTSMNNLSYTYALGGRLDESLYWTRRSWPLSAKGPNDFYHVTVPLLWMRDDELTRRWLAEAGRQRDHPRTQITLAVLQVYLGDTAGALVRARAAAQTFAGDEEVAFTRNDLAILAGAADAETLNEQMFRTAADVPGVVLPESARLRYAFLLQRRGDTRARALIEDAESRARARVTGGDLASTTFFDIAVARALLGDAKGALAELQHAYENGWRDYAIASIDPMLAALRDHPGFRSLLDRAMRDVAMQRERAKERGLLDLSSLIGRPLA